MVLMEGVLSVTLLRSWREVNLLFAPSALRRVYKKCLHFDSSADIRSEDSSDILDLEYIENLIYNILTLVGCKNVQIENVIKGRPRHYFEVIAWHSDSYW